jgi:hypothetical protein
LVGNLRLSLVWCVRSCVFPPTFIARLMVPISPIHRSPGGFASGVQKRNRGFLLGLRMFGPIHMPHPITCNDLFSVNPACLLRLLFHNLTERNMCPFYPSTLLSFTPHNFSQRGSRLPENPGENALCTCASVFLVITSLRSLVLVYCWCSAAEIPLIVSLVRPASS